MDKKCKLVKSPVVGNCYAVCCSEMIIIRGILDSIEPGGTAIVYDIDGGEREEVPLSNIYELQDEFCKLESQVRPKCLRIVPVTSLILRLFVSALMD